MGCRRRFELGEGRLVRLGRGPDGSVTLGPRLPGRGAWVCGDDRRCLDLALRPKVLRRALRFEPSPEATATLRSHFPVLAADARD